jgi:hypothetical protein
VDQIHDVAAIAEQMSASSEEITASVTESANNHLIPFSNRLPKIQFVCLYTCQTIELPKLYILPLERWNII